MKRKHYVIALGLGLLAMIVLLFWPSSREPYPPLAEKPTTPQAAEAVPDALEKFEREREEKSRNLVGVIESMLNTPIVFYGEVVDQRGDPVPDAEVGYGLLDKFNESGSLGKSVADENGHFTISGVRGAVISVSVHKEGYYLIHNISNQSFAYGYGTDPYHKPPPSRDVPAVFVLHKMGETEPLVMIKNRLFRIAKDGTPISVDLVTGKTSDTGQITVQAWTGEHVSGGPRFYDWRCRISVPGGGLVERKGQFDFKAPTDGYREFDEIVMSKEDEHWSADVNRSYFIRLSGGRHALIQFRMLAGGEHFFDLESFLNPKIGSLNLEYDPAKRLMP